MMSRRMDKGKEREGSERDQSGWGGTGLAK